MTSEQTVNHLRQAKHNEKLVDFLNKEIPDDFFDWKITIAFYATLHYVRAFYTSKGIILGHSHLSIAENINPLKASAILPFDIFHYKLYNTLYLYSRNARYSGLQEHHKFNEKLRMESVICQHNLKIIKEYLIKSGLRI